MIDSANSCEIFDILDFGVTRQNSWYPEVECRTRANQFFVRTSYLVSVDVHAVLEGTLTIGDSFFAERTVEMIGA